MQEARRWNWSQLPREHEGARLADARQVEGAARPEQEVLAQARVGPGAGLDGAGRGRAGHDLRRLDRLAPQIELLQLAPDQAAEGAAEAEADAELGPGARQIGQQGKLVADGNGGLGDPGHRIFILLETRG